MINNFEKCKTCKYQSVYSNNFKKYKLRTISGILPHREYSGDYWEETIPLIKKYLIFHGLKPDHKLLDLGAGGLRCGLSVVPYLNKNNFYAIDINKYLLEDGYKHEIIANNLQDKFPQTNIKITHDYNSMDWNILFDYIWSFSLWTHLDKLECDKCLCEVSKTLKQGGIYLTTCFIVDDDKYLLPNCVVSDVKIMTHPTKDPYHHCLTYFKEMAEKYNMDMEYMGHNECCPRQHDIIKFIKKF
jgi:cyclopropane fatty-acyl-phospholipid synthase-like methyltransferase